MTEKRTSVQETLNSIGNSMHVLRSSDEKTQAALRVIYDNATVIYGDRSPTLPNGQSNPVNLRYRDQSFWFDVNPATEYQPRTVNINGAGILPNRTLHVWEQGDRLQYEVRKNNGVGLVPGVVYARRLFHAFNSQQLELDDLIGTID